MSLADWARNGWLVEHRTSANEIAELFAVVDRDLTDSTAAALSADWRLNIAYNAALQAATAALSAAGYRASRDQHHYRVIQSLQHTIGWKRELINRLDAFRKKRNVGGYERVGAASDLEADEMRELAERLRGEVLGWIRSNHKDLATKLRTA